MLNDDKTSFQFVEACLTNYFGMSLSEARVISKRVNDEGSAVVGSFTLEVAEHKTALCQRDAAAKSFPFECGPVRL